MALLIYIREYDVQDRVSFAHVLIWQLTIWLPWSLCFVILKRGIHKYRMSRLMLIVGIILWIGAHFYWFFYLSDNFSPYLGLPGTGYGVYPYFFIFWTLVDLALMRLGLTWLTQTDKPKHTTAPIRFELTRGDKKYFCVPNQIYWLSAEGYNTRLYTEEGIFIMRKSLSHYYEQLDHTKFKRIHRSTIVNVNYVVGLSRGPNKSLMVMLKDGNQRRVSRNYVKETRSYFKTMSS